MFDYCILNDEAWIEFNTWKWKCKAQKLCFSSDKKSASLRTVFYHRKGEIFKPRRNPYLPIRFVSSGTKYQSKITHQWLKLANELIEYMKNHNMSSEIAFIPGMYDMRPWVWDESFKVGYKYTYLIKLPHALKNVTGNYRNRIRKAEKSGLSCERTTRIKDVYPCIEQIESKLSFTHRMSLRDLETAQRILGEDKFRTYACFNGKGEAVSVSIALYGGTGVAIGWIGACNKEYMSSGASQLVEAYTIEDLGNSGAAYYDLFGAGLPGIANAKSYWNGSLVLYPYVYGSTFHERVFSRIRMIGQHLLSKL